MKQIHTSKAPKAIGSYSQAMQAGDFLWVSGQIPLVAETMQLVSEDIAEQTKQALFNLEMILLEAQLTKQNVVKVTIFTTQIQSFQEINQVYSEFFGEHRPARAVVEVSRLPREVQIEIEAVAYCKAQR